GSLPAGPGRRRQPVDLRVLRGRDPLGDVAPRQRHLVLLHRLGDHGRTPLPETHDVRLGGRLHRPLRDRRAVDRGLPAVTDSRLIVVGGGLAGLMTAVRAAELGAAVDLFSIVPVKRSHSVSAQGGINGAVNTKGEGDSPEIHFDDTVYGGDFLADQPPVKAMCYAAPGIINLLDRMGVMFNRTPEGLLDFRRFGGTKYHRTAFAGA